MSAAPGNAAIWYAPDGYDPKARGINGRRVAGESFLRGLMEHGRGAELVGLVAGGADARHMAEFGKAAGLKRPLRAVPLARPERIAPLDVVSYPGPNIASEAWRRATHGGSAWALQGITHTTATKSVQQSLFDLRAAPQEAWDAVICTSRAVEASLLAQMELSDAWLAQRFGGTIPPRPLMPVIPLGVNCADFIRDPALGHDLRRRLGIAEGDIACAIVARLTPHEKFDPLPLFLALAATQAERAASGWSGRFHLVLCGRFDGEGARKIFREGATRLMPDCRMHLLDGADREKRRATLSGADLYLFPIDNVQETFGLGPIEAMAAGLPVIASDWDGIRDTVSPDCGILIPTEAAREDLTRALALRHYTGSDSYPQYLSQLSALVRLEMAALSRALVTLAADRSLRARMGAAGQARARALFDWSAVIPQYEALWAEQAAMIAHARRTGAGHAPLQAGRLPPAPAPGHVFAAWPSRHGPAPARRYRAAPGRPALMVQEMLDLRAYAAMRRQFEPPQRISATLDALSLAGPGGATPENLAQASGLALTAVERSLIWLMKYGYAEEAS